MLVVLAGISLVSGTSLGGLFEITHELAENNILKFKKIPAVVDIYETVSGPLALEDRIAFEESMLAEKRYVDVGAKKPLLFFVVRRENEPFAVALESYGQGFGGKLGVMVGVDLETEDLVAIGVTTMSETPGVGTRVKEKDFTGQFAGMGGEAVFKVKKDGGEIDAITGATISCRAVADAVGRARATYAEHRSTIRAAVDSPPGDV
jgi:electron transport complex protein RnfG